MAESISRRAAMAGGAGAMILSARAALGTAANSAVTLGILGTGGRGRYVGTLFAKDPRARVVAICDIFADRIDLAKTQVPGADQARVFRSHEEMLAMADLDAVLIATPVFLHPLHFEAAVRARKHIYCEKPAGADVAGVQRLLRAAQAAPPSKNIAFGFQQRYSPEYLAAEQILRSGRLGELLLMRSNWILGGAALQPFRSPYPPEDQKLRHWGAWKEYSGDFIVEQDCHGLDVLNWFAQGHPLRASGVGGRRKRAYGDNSDHLNVTFEYAGGLKGFLAATQLAVKRYWEVNEQFFGSEGVLEVERKYYKWYRGPEDVVEVKSKREITIDAVEAFLDRVVRGKPENAAPGACESTFTSLLGRMAIETGRVVTWEEMLGSA
jgi:predicted dehydrogenase